VPADAGATGTRPQDAERPLRVLLLVGDPRQSRVAHALLADCSVETVSTTALASEEMRERLASFDALLLDAESVPLHVRRGVVRNALSRVAEREPQLRPIVLAAQGDTETARAAADAGAWDVLAREDVPGELIRRLRAAARLRRLQGPPAPAQGAPQEPEAVAEGAPSIGSERRMSAWGRGVAATDVPMLITGERGTGKQLAALAIHERSPRAHGPFIPIDCAVIPRERIEVELFGRESPVVAGTTDARRGRFEAADGGTLYVAAIDELPLRLQAGLLHFLGHRVVERVGGHAPIRLDVRVIAATERDLRSAVERGEFLEDLGDRLAVFRVHLPPLRERGEDIAMLARWYLDRSARQEGRALEGFSEAAIAALRAARWPGNVRELIDRVHRAVVMAEGPRVTPADLGLAEPRAETGNGTLRGAQSRAESESVWSALRRTGWNLSEAARALGISRAELSDLMHRHRIPERASD